MPEKRKVSAIATMDILESFYRMTGKRPDPKKAFIIDEWEIFGRLLARLQKKGVMPGKEIKITIEEL